MNGEIFLAYVEQELAPTLKSGDIVIMDNLRAHKVAGVREAIERAVARSLYLSPHSPDLNPIEMVFAKLKALSRKAAMRSIPMLWDKIGELLDALNTTECRHYFRHAGICVKLSGKCSSAPIEVGTSCRMTGTRSAL